MSRESLSKSELYIANLFAQENADLKHVHGTLIEHGRYGVNVGAGEGKLLQFFVGLTQAKLVVEVGTLHAYSTLWMAEALPEGGKIISIEKDEKTYAIAKDNVSRSRLANKVELRQGDALEVLNVLSKEFQRVHVMPDMIFIDADKVNYRYYLDWAMQAVRVGALIVGDNTFLFGALINEDRGEKASPTAMDSMKYFNETLAAAKNFRAIMIPTREGMTLAQRLS